MAEQMATGGNAFYKIAVSGQPDVVSDAPDDTLNLASATGAGAGITIATNATTDTVTVALAAGGVYDLTNDAAFLAAYNAGTDCTSILQNILTNLLSWGYDSIYIPYRTGKTVKCANQLLVPAEVSIYRHRKAKLEYTGTADQVFVIVGAANTYNGNVYIDLEVVRTTPAVWASKPNDTGILLHSPNFSKLFVGADMFTNGVVVQAGTQPASWLDIQLYLIRDAKFGLTFYTTANNVNSYINEIRLSHADGEFNISTDCHLINPYVAGSSFPVGIRFRSDFNASPFDNHYHEKPCFELNGGGHYGYVAPYQFDGSVNTLVARNIRQESGGTTGLIRHVSGVAHSIDMHIGYTDSTFKLADMYDSVAGQNYFSNVRIWGTQFPGSGGGNTWRSPNLGAVSNQYDAAGRIYVPGFYWHSSADNTRQKRSIGTANTISSDSIEIVDTDAIGLLIQLGDCRMFRVRPVVKSGGANLRQGFIPWNEALTQRHAPAYLTANVTLGAITSFNYWQGGKYDTDPTITVPGGTGLVLGAITRDGNGAITNVAVVSGGSGFTNGATANIVSNDKHWIQGPGFQEDEISWYGCYYDNGANPQGYSVWVREGVKYVEWRGRATGGSVHLAGFVIESLDGNPITARSWFGGYSDFVKRKIAFDPNGVSLKGSFAQGEVLEYDGRSIVGEPTGFSYRGGTAWDQILPSSSLQPLDAELTALAGLTSAADTLAYFTGSGTAGTTTLTGYGRSLIDDANAPAARSTLGLGTGATLNISVGTSAPGSPSVNDLWVDTN